jgi:hypothetical protein
MNALLRYGWLSLVLGCGSLAAACEAPSDSCGPPPCVVEDQQPSWIFMHSTYSHDPMTGARVAQYERIAPVEPLEDERNVTSSYRRTQTNLRGADGSTDTYYQVQAWGNGRGGMDAEWERYHDAWKESILQGGYYNAGPGNGFVGSGNGFSFGRGNRGNWGRGNWGSQGGWQNNGGSWQQGGNWNNGVPWRQQGGNWNDGGPPQGP